jgi:hypothetical protein
MQNQIDTELQRPLIKWRRKRRIDNRLYTVPPTDVGKALQINNIIVWIGRRFADQNARGRSDRSFNSLVVAGPSHRHFDAITVQHLSEKLTSPAVRIICDNDMGPMGEHGKQRRRDCGHAAGKE